jgi:hypothetical protein
MYLPMAVNQNVNSIEHHKVIYFNVHEIPIAFIIIQPTSANSGKPTVDSAAHSSHFAVDLGCDTASGVSLVNTPTVH